MADAKITELPEATLPLAGAELVPIVQGAVTKRIQASLLASELARLGTPITTTFAYASGAEGFTLLHDDVSEAGRSYIPSATNQSATGIWCGVITGTAAAIRMISSFPGAQQPSIEVSVDGGAYSTVSAASDADFYPLFSGLSDTAHFVVFRRTGSAAYIYTPIASNSFRVTGVAPAISPAGEWAQPGDASPKHVVSCGLSATTFTNPAGDFDTYRMGPSRQPPSQPSDVQAVGRGSVCIRTTSTEIWIACQNRFVGIIANGTFSFHDTGTASANGTAGVRVLRITGLAAGSKNITVFASRNLTPTAAWLSVGVPLGQSFSTVTGFNRAHVFGDSITQGVEIGSRSGDEVSVRVDVDRAWYASGFVAGNFGVAGWTFSDLLTNMTSMLATLTVTSSDVAYVALGQNDTTPTSSQVTDTANALVAKGYGKVIFRGVLPVPGNSHTAKNTTISNAITALGDSRVRYINPNAWTEMAVNTPGFRDGLHFDVDGYEALLTRMLVALPSALA